MQDPNAQYIPVVLVQSMPVPKAPQWQTLSFFVTPSWLHCFVVNVHDTGFVPFEQTNPVDSLQNLVPSQRHFAVLEVKPLVCVQSDAAMHRQKLALLEVHDAVEVESVLYLRSL